MHLVYLSEISSITWIVIVSDNTTAVENIE